MRLLRAGCAVLAASWGCALAQAAASADAAVCAGMPAEPRIHVRFEDRPIARDERRSVQELTRMSGGARGSHHSVMGLTVAQPAARMQWSAPELQPAAAGGAGVCARPVFTVELAFSTLEVYLARELADGCRRGIVDAHEMEHVTAWRQHLRAGARLMETALRAELGAPAPFASAEAAQGALRARADAMVGSLLPRLRESVMAAHGSIDSPQSYQFTERQLRACP